MTISIKKTEVADITTDDQNFRTLSKFKKCKVFKHLGNPIMISTF